MSTTILHGKYKVCDCEHMGDMEAAESFLLRLGLEPTDKYWDRHDGGEAYIEFTCPASKLASVYPKIRSTAIFEEDIFPYLPKGEGYDMGGQFKIVSETEFRDIHDELTKDTSLGFENRIPLRATFFSYADIDPNAIIERVIHAFPDPDKAKPICCSKDPTRDTNDYSYLFLMPASQITEPVMTRIGDNLFKFHSLFKDLGVSGFCKTYHDLIYNGKGYADFQENVRKQAELNRKQEDTKKEQTTAKRRGRGR